jgi:hypothetical protein
MAGLNILPPSAPESAQQKRGFFKRLLKGKETGPAKAPTPSAQEELVSFDNSLGVSEEEQFDLEEIKRKVGLVDELDITEQPPAPPATTDELPPQELPPDELRLEDLDLAAQPEPMEQPVKMEQQPASSFEEDLPDLSPHVAPLEGSWGLAEPEKEDEKHEEMQEEKLSEWKEKPEQPVISGSDWDVPPPPEPYRAKHHKAIEKREETVAEQATETKAEPRDWAAEPESPATPATAETPEPRLGTAHLKKLEEEHKKLEKELSSLVKEPLPELPPPDHPLEKPAPEGQEFILKNGKPLKNLRELTEMLEHIDTETFFHHVNAERNDFANWVRHSLKDEKLADELKDAKSRKEILRILKEHGKRAEKRFSEQGKRLEITIKGRAEKLAHAGKLHGKLTELKAELVRKSAELADQKRLLTEEVNKRLSGEVAKRVKEERKKVDQLRKEAEQTKAEYERRLTVVEQALRKRFEQRSRLLTEREQSIAAKQDSLKKIELTLKEEHERFTKERAGAQPLIDEARRAAGQLADLAAERKRLDEDRRRLREERESAASERQLLVSWEEALAKRESDGKRERASLEKQQQELERQGTALRQRQEELLRKRGTFEQQEKGFREEEKKTLAKLREEERRADAKARKAQKADEELKANLQERRKVTQYIKEAEGTLTKREQTLAGADFHDYLQEKLRSLKKEEAPPSENVKNLRIYSLIDRARQALEHGEAGEATEIYNKVRDLFNKERLSPQEKAVLYTTIRELYDDIHLANLK